MLVKRFHAAKLCWEAGHGTCLLSLAHLLRACCVLIASQATRNAAILVAISRICSKAEEPEKYYENSRRHVFISDDSLIKRNALATSALHQICMGPRGPAQRSYAPPQ